MSKKAFLFAGQGAQYLGMGKDISHNFKVSDHIFEKASDALSMDVKKLCFEEENLLNKTEYTQPAILTTSVALLQALYTYDIKPDVVAGLSLGEYSALVANGAFDFADAVKVVKKRGQYMQEAVPEGVGGMAAVLGCERSTVQQVCGEIKEVYPANFNCPGQIVIAGKKQAVDKAGEALLEAGARRVLKLKVSGPFHTPLLEKAAVWLQEELEQIELRDIAIPYITNVTADYVTDSKDIKGWLRAQVISPVNWEDTIRRMIQDGVDTFIEIGPGKVLSGFLKKIDRKKTCVNIEDSKTLEKAITLLGGI